MSQPTLALLTMVFMLTATLVAATRPSANRANRCSDLPSREAPRPLMETVDEATEKLLREIESNETNRRFTTLVESHAATLRAGAAEKGSEYVVLVVPGFLYRSLPANGADLAAPRRLFSNLGIDVRLLEVGESSPVEQNSQQIKDSLRAFARDGQKVILVSASKGGAETLEALSQLGPRSTETVAAWINIAGTLNGTQLADRAMCGVDRLLTKAAHTVCRWDLGGVLSLSPAVRQPRRSFEDLPENLLVINVIAAPKSNEISKRAREGYRALAALGPNDGLTLLEDAMVPGRITVARRGTDHFFGGTAIDELAYGLLRTVEEHLAIPPREDHGQSS